MRLPWKPFGRWVSVLAVSAAYLVLALAMTFPLVFRFATHHAGSAGDDMVILWNLWWVKHAVFDLATNPMYTDYIFYPYEIGLSMHALIPLNMVLSLPLMPFLPTHVIYNIITIASYVLTGIGAFLLLERLTENRRAAFIGGALYTVCSGNHLINLGMVQWIPFYALCLMKAMTEEKGAVRHAIAAGIFLAFNFLSEPFYAIMLIPFTLLYAGYVAATGRLAAGRTGLRALAVFFVSAFVSSPMFYYAVSDTMAGRTREVPREGLDYNFADLLGFFSPSTGNPVVGRFAFDNLFVSKSNYTYIGFGVLLLAAIGWRCAREEGKRLGFWLLVAVTYVVFSLGPRLHLLGHPLPLPLPFAFMKHIPVLDNIHSPIRVYPITMLAFVVFAAFGVKRLLAKRKPVLALLLALVLVEFLPLPYPTHRIEVPEAYGIIAGDEQAQAVLEVPFFARDTFNYIGLPLPATIQYCQSVHRKKLFNGIVSRLGPEHIFLSLLNIPVVRNVAAAQMGLTPPPASVEADKRLARETVDLFGLDYVVVHKDYNDYATDMAHQFLKFAVPMEKRYEDGELVIYKTLRTRHLSTDIDCGAEQSIPYLMRGWINGQRDGGTTFAWSTGKESVVLVNLTQGKGYTVRLRMRPHPSLVDRRVDVLVNGSPAGRLSLEDGWRDYTLDISKEDVRDGLNKLVFRHAGSIRPGGDFGGLWAEGALVEYLRRMYLPNQKDDEVVVLDWEQDNTKFRGAGVSIAVDRISLGPGGGR